MLLCCGLAATVLWIAVLWGKEVTYTAVVSGFVHEIWADDDVESIHSNWRNAQTNAYQAVMQARLQQNANDVAGLLMNYFWQRAFSWEGDNAPAFTNAIIRLQAAARAYNGPAFSSFRPLLLADLDADLDRAVRNEMTEADKAAYRATVAAWRCWQYLGLYRKLFLALADDGAFRTPPTDWTSDPSLRRVEEAQTNCLAVVTNLWKLGALTNVSRIAANRLCADPDDPAGHLLAFDCALLNLDVRGLTNHCSALTAHLAAETNALPSKLRTSLLRELQRIPFVARQLSAVGSQLNTPPYLPSGRAYPHAEALKVLLDNAATPAEGARP